jgi:hypothetical protein
VEAVKLLPETAVALGTVMVVVPRGFIVKVVVTGFAEARRVCDESFWAATEDGNTSTWPADVKLVTMGNEVCCPVVDFVTVVAVVIVNGNVLVEVGVMLIVVVEAFDEGLLLVDVVDNVVVEYVLASSVVVVTNGAK